MYVTIDKLPKTSRVWIYQANRNLSAPEIALITKSLTQFCEQWAAHGTPLQTSFSIDHNRFIALAVNEDASAPSGCSIDGSVRALKTLEQALKVDFFNREEVAFLDGTDILTYPLSNLKKLFAEGILHENSIALNTLVQSLEDWEENRQVKVRESWLKRYIPKVPVS
jgi:hypothetical protein